MPTSTFDEAQQRQYQYKAVTCIDDGAATDPTLWRHRNVWPRPGKGYRSADREHAPCVLYHLKVDNTANDAEAQVLALWDSPNPDFESDAPDWVFPIAADSIINIPFPRGAVFQNALSLAVGTTLAMTTGPTAAVTVTIIAQ